VKVNVAGGASVNRDECENLFIKNLVCMEKGLITSAKSLF